MGLTWVYVIPLYNQLESDTQTSSATGSILFIDASIRDLVSQRPPVGTTLTLYSDNAIVLLDNTWSYNFRLVDSENWQYNDTHLGQIAYLVKNTRYQLELGEHQYLQGPSQQDYWSINYTDADRYSDVAVVNMSRPSWEGDRETFSLGYRTTVSWNATYDPAGIVSPKIVVTLTAIRLIHYGKNSTGHNTYQLKLDYKGVESSSWYNTTRVANNGCFYLYMDVTDQAGTTFTETMLMRNFTEMYPSYSLDQTYEIQLRFRHINVNCTIL